MQRDTLRIDDQPGKHPEQRILRLDGALVMTTMFDFQAMVRADKSRSLNIDFTNVPYVDSAGIGALVGAYVTRQQGGTKPRTCRSKRSRPQCSFGYPRGAILPLL